MSKKQFDNIEDKIKEAADNNQPAFDDAAWGKMVLLLDKYSRRKRPVLLLWLVPLLLALTAGGGYLFFNGTTNKEKITAAVQAIKENKTEIKNTNKPGNSVQEKNAQSATTSAADKIIPVSEPVKNKGQQANNNGNKYTKNNFNIDKNKESTNSTLDKISYAKKEKVIPGSDKKNVDNVTENNSNKKEANVPDEIIADKKLLSVDNIEETEKVPAQLSNANTAVDKKIKIATAAPKDTTVQKTPAITADKKNKKAIDKNKNSRFYFLALVGADAASVKFFSFSNSRLAATYGIGVGFQLTKKLSVQSGFYAGQKKYIAGPGDYNAKAGSYWSQVKIKKVDAVCMVYEIPLALRYTFSQKKSVALFATAGLSSYIMKKEDYFYNYIHYNMPLSGRYIYTGNKNFFSILSFSAGMEKKLSNRISLLVSPSVSIPIAGVGDGSVKLFSAGLQAGIKFQPGSHLH